MFFGGCHSGTFNKPNGSLCGCLAIKGNLGFSNAKFFSGPKTFRTGHKLLPFGKIENYSRYLTSRYARVCPLPLKVDLRASSSRAAISQILPWNSAWMSSWIFHEKCYLNEAEFSIVHQIKTSGKIVSVKATRQFPSLCIYRTEWMLSSRSWWCHYGVIYERLRAVCLPQFSRKKSHFCWHKMKNIETLKILI